MYETEQKQIVDSLHTPFDSRAWLVVGLKGVDKKKFAEDVVFQLTDVRTKYNPSVKWICCGLTEASKKEIQKSILAGEALEEKNWARKTEITIEDVQEGTRFLSLKSDALKILIFDLADEMNENAQNALLKTLEEPSSGSLILLLSENPGHLLPTILSRCQKVHLLPPNKDIFERTFQQKHPELNIDEIHDIAFLSNDVIDEAEALLKLDGVSIYRELKELLNTSLELDTIALIAFSEKISQDKGLFEIGISCFLKYINYLAREAAISSLSKANSLSDVYANIKRHVEEISSKNLDKKQNIISMILKIREVL